jgi:hypothetical protein
VTPFVVTPGPQAVASAEKKKVRYLLSSRLFCCIGAGEMNRTPDLLITNDGISVFAFVDFY